LHHRYLPFAAMFLSSFPVDAKPVCAPVNLRCEYLVNPLGLDVAKPRLSWQMEDARRGAKQTAYRILVASRPQLLQEGKADVWDSGKIASDQSVHVVYGGLPLESRRRVWWQVRVWDKDGKPSPYSATAFWEMGLLKPADWRAKWIGQAENVTEARAAKTGGPALLLRKAFTLPRAVRSARVYVTALGSYRLHVNGKRVGKDVLTPDWTDYRKRVPYQVYDVTDLLKQGDNAVGAILGDGWYASALGWTLQRFNFGPPPTRFLMQMRVQYADGAEETIVSDESWRVDQGPILRSEIYAGETYDARREQPGWDRPGFNDSTWKAADVLETAPLALSAQRSPTIQITETLKPKVVTTPAPGVYVFDMGQNMVGWVRLKVKGEAGTQVRLRFAEILKPDGNIYVENLRRAEATDTYILRGSGEEIFEPHFTYHGFRYVEVTGYPGTPGQDAITGQVLHTAAPLSGKFACSDEMVNQLWRNILWGQRGNLHSVPTDCPQRDERLGWMGDAQVFWRTACYNMDLAAFTDKWMRDVVEAQSPAGGFANVSPRVILPLEGAPAWGDAGVIVPWTAYRQYGDTRLIEENWTAMEKWMNYIHSANPDLIWSKRRSADFGDWVPANSETPKDVIATAYWAYDAHLMAQMARAIGKTADARRYEDLFQGIRAAFLKKFVKEDGTVGNGSQTCYVLALHFGLVTGNLAERAMQHLVADIEKRGGHLSTGFLGTAYLMPALTENGRHDVACRLLRNKTYPSWGYMIEKGATTIWERWNGDTGDPGMNSFNHFAFGAVGEWLYRHLAGIDTDPNAPGYRRIILRPHPGPGLTDARAEYDSVYGRIVSAWSQKPDGTFTLNATIPANTTAAVYLPTTDANRVTESDKPITSGSGIRLLRMQDGHAIYEVAAGRYQLKVRGAGR